MLKTLDLSHSQAHPHTFTCPITPLSLSISHTPVVVHCSRRCLARHGPSDPSGSLGAVVLPELDCGGFPVLLGPVVVTYVEGEEVKTKASGKKISKKHTYSCKTLMGMKLDGK